MKDMVMQFLGTGAGEGIPTPFCRCKVCENARSIGGTEVRMRSCFRVSEELMIDMGSDIFAECIRNNTDLYDLKYLLITHTHEDHFNLFNLFLKAMISRGNGEKVHIYLTEEAYDFPALFDTMQLDGKKNFFTGQLSNHFTFHQLHFWKETKIGDCFVTPIRGAHPGHLEKTSANYLIKLPNAQMLLYASDTGYYTDETMNFLKEKPLDFLIVEATFGSCDRGNTPYSHLDVKSVNYLCNKLYEQGTITDYTNVFLTHINQEQEYTHADLENFYQNYQVPYSIKVAYDGLSIKNLFR